MKDKARAWGIVAAALIMLIAVYGVVINCFSIFIVPASKARGIERDAFSLCLTIMFLSYMVSSSISGRIYSKLSPRVMMIISSFLIPLFYYLNGCVKSVLPLYFFSFVIGFLLPFLSFTAFSVIIKDWFGEKSGLPTGIAFTGSGIGGMLWSLILGRWIEVIGPDFAYRRAAVIMAAIAIPISIFFIKGRTPSYSIPKKSSRAGEVLKKDGCWRVLLISFLVGLTPLFVSQSMVPNALDHGLGQSYASMLNAFFMGGLCIAKIIMGRSFDRLGTSKTISIGLVCGIFSLFGVLFISLKALHIPFLIVASLNATIQSMAPPMLALDVAKGDDFSSLSGLCVAFNYLGCALAPLILNFSYVRMGSYNLVLYIDIALVLFTLLLCLRNGRKAKA